MGNKLYVGNLPFSVTDTEITDLFGQYGAVTSVNLISDRVSGRPKGFGFVEMGSSEEAGKAIAELNGKDFGGRPLTVNEARPQEKREGGGGFGGGGGGFRRNKRY